MTVRTVNPAIAKFISLSPEAQLVLISSSNQENSNIFHIGSSASNKEAYFALNNNKLISFKSSQINIPAQLTIHGNLSGAPGASNNNLGSHTNMWKDIYLDGNIIQINNAVIDYEINDPGSCDCHISDISFYNSQTDNYISIATESLHIQHVDDYYSIFSLNNEGTAVISSYKPDHTLINSINISEGTTAMLPQGSNLYFSASRVSELAQSLNLTSADYETTTSNNLLIQITSTSNDIINQAALIQSVIASKLEISSNQIYSNLLSSNINTSNTISQTITHFTSNINAASNNIMKLIILQDINISNITSITSNSISHTINITSNLLTSTLGTYNSNINQYTTVASNSIISSVQSSSNDIIENINSINTNISNIIFSTYSTLNEAISDTSNAITSNISLKTSISSNYITTNIINMLTSNITSSSNIFINQVLAYTSNASNLVSDASNLFNQAIATTSNLAANTIADLTTDQILQNSQYKFIVNNTFSSNLTTSNITVIGNITPSMNDKFNLGSPTRRWKDLYISGNTIYLDNIAISSDPVTNGITIKDAVTDAPVEIIVSSIKLQDTETGQLTVIKSTNNELNFASAAVEDFAIQINTDQVIEGSKLFFKPQLVEEIATASNITSSQNTQTIYNQLTSNIDALKSDNIQQPNNSSNKFIVNGTFNQNLRVNATVSASNLNVIGDETYIRTVSFQTENIEIISQTYAGPAFVINYNASNITRPSVAEFYYSSSNLALIIKDDGKVGINTSVPSQALDVAGNIKFSGSINGISSNTLSYLKDTACNIQMQINDTIISTYSYTSNVSNILQSSITSTSNSLITTLTSLSTNQSNITSNINSWMLSLLSTTISSINSNITNANTATSNIIGRTFDTYQTSITNSSNSLIAVITDLSSNMSNLVSTTSNQQIQTQLSTSSTLDSNLSAILSNRWRLTGANNLYFTSNVGIGTTSPQYTLDVYGNIKFSDRILTTSPIASVSSNEIEFLRNLTASIQTQIDNTSNSSSNFILLVSSNLTSNLTQVNNDLNQRITQLDTDTSNYTSNIFMLTLNNTSLANTSHIINTRILDLNFSRWATTNTCNFIIDGNVGICTSSMTSKLELFGGDLQITNGNIKKTIDESTVENYQLERWKDSDTYYNPDGPQFIYYQEGNVGIGTINPVTNLHVSGSVSQAAQVLNYFSCNVDFTSGSYALSDTCAIFESSILVKDTVAASSDQRIKKNIADINDDSALQKILSIQPKAYNYIDPITSTEKVYGFIAQQVQEVIPEAIYIQKAVVPNIFCTASCFLNLIIFDASSIHEIKTDLLTVNTRISIIDITGKQDMYTIIFVSEMSITIDRNIQSEVVFIYGTEVDDFHSLDKSYIYTLNVCATQKLSEKINNLTQRIARIENSLQ